MRVPRLGRRGWLLAVEVALLGVGIVAAFLSLSAARAGLSTSLRVPHPARTYFVGRGSDPIPDASYSDLASWHERQGIFSRLGAFLVWGPVAVATESQSVGVNAAAVTKDLTAFLPQRMAAGRPLTDSDFFSGSRSVLVSEGLATRLGLTAGSMIRTADWGVFRIVGILPGWARFPYPGQPDLIIPTVPDSRAG